MSTLQLPAGENILMAAFRAVQSGSSVAPANLADEYGKFFTTTALPAPAKSQKFDIFSMYNPNIRIVVQSNTVTE